MDKATEEFIQTYLQSLETETGSEDERDVLSSDIEKEEEIEIETPKDVLLFNNKKERNFIDLSFEKEVKRKKTSEYFVKKCIPNEKVGTVDSYDSNISISQFSEDGELFFTGALDQFMRFYTKDELYTAQENNRNAIPFKQIKGNNLGYTFIDQLVSRNNEYCVYSSWSKQINLQYINEDKKESYELGTLATQICPFSIRLNYQNTELLAGCSDKCIYIIDLETKSQTKFVAHDLDVNAVCYINEHVFISGSDDTSIKLWDRREEKMVGHFMGHSQGISFIHSKGDQTHFISNSKDQSIKLWDIRNYQTHEIKKTNIQKWDYRYQQLPTLSRRKSCCDTSLQSYHGHQVLQTLIRCYFSPDSTNNEYIYTGSQDGNVVIYDLFSGKIVQKLKGHTNVIRDVTWSKCGSSILSSSWDRSISHWKYVNKNF